MTGVMSHGVLGIGTGDVRCSRRWNDRNGHSWSPFGRWMRQPSQKPVERPTVHDALGGNPRETRMCKRSFGIRELRGGVRIAVECEETAGGQGAGRQGVIEILPRGIAIDLYRHASLSRRGEYRVPIGDYTGTRPGYPTARVREDPNGRVRDGGEHAVGLILAPS